MRAVGSLELSVDARLTRKLTGQKTAAGKILDHSKKRRRRRSRRVTHLGKAESGHIVLGFGVPETQELISANSLRDQRNNIIATKVVHALCKGL